MSKPVINSIKPFHATKTSKVSMTYIGNLPYSNRIIIYDATTLSVVFDDTQSGFTLEHTIPANTLTNGKKYAIQGQVFDSVGNASILSDKAYFWCFATPSFFFSNVNNDDTITTASFYANLVYDQPDWEDIAEYRFYLYDEVKNLLVESEAYYTTDNMNYPYRGLEDDKFYYIRAIGATQNGIQMDTGYIKVFVNYENPEDYKLIYAECNEQNSVVTYQTNFVVINPSDTTTQYEYENGWINLLDKTLVYDQDFIVDGDFTMSIRGKDLYRNATILKCSNDKMGFTLSSYIYDDGQMRYKLTVPNGICNYVLYSEPIMPEMWDIVTIHIRRINNVYQLYCFIEEGEEEKYNMWFGQQRPTASTLAMYDIWIDVDEPGVTRVDKDNVNVFYRKDEPTLLADDKYDIWIGE